MSGVLSVSNGGTGSSSFLTDRILVGGASIYSSTLYWDIVNSRLGVGTINPAYSVDIVGVA